MFSLSRFSMLIAAFFLGISAATGAIAGVAYYAANSISINKIEELTSGAVNIPIEGIIGENPEVDLCDLTLVDLFGEAAQLTSLGENLTINLLISRYDLILNEQIEKFLSPESRNLPIAYLAMEEGRQAFLSTIYIGNIQGFDCLKPDGTKGSPSDETTYWYNPKTNAAVTGLNEILADFNLGDIIKGNFHTDTVLDNVLIADIIGYTRNEDDNAWLDSSGNEVHGVMAVFAGHTVLEIDEELHRVRIGELLGYEQDETGWWCERDASGNLIKVHTFMNTISSRNMDGLNDLMDDIKLSDIIPDKDMKGFIGMIPPDTNLNNISDVINQVFTKKTMGEFVEAGAITFENEADKINFLNSDFADMDISSLLTVISKLPTGITTTP